MMDTSNSQGTFQIVYDGTTSYPDITNYWTSYVVSGRSYIFRVKGKYQNGFTSYSVNSLPIWACSPPSDLPRPHLVSVSSMQITLSWSEPFIVGSCDLKGFALYMNDGQGGSDMTEIDSA